MALLLALDLGTSSVKCLLMRADGSVVRVHSEPYPTASPRPGWVEQQPEDWVRAAIAAAAVCLQQAEPHDVCMISLSGHMSGLVLADQDGEPLLPCIPLADTRSVRQTDHLRQLLQERIAAITGNPVLDAFLAPKLLWVKEHHPEIYERAAHLLFPKDYLRFRLTGAFATDPTDAGNSLLFDPFKQAWDYDLAAAAGIRRELLPDVLPPYEVAGKLTQAMGHQLGLPAGIPVAVGAADMAAGALGTGAVNAGDTCLTIGTSATMISVTDDISKEAFGQVTFHPHVLPGTFYALGSHFSGGLSLNWLSSLFHEAVSYDALQELARAAEQVPPGSEGVLFLPFLTGSGSPRFNPRMSGSFLGLTVSTGRSSMFRAVLEGIACDLKETLSLFDRINQSPIRSIRVGGGGAKISLWPNIFAAMFERPVHLLNHADASAMGAAMIGGYAAGVFPDLKAISSALTQPVETIRPEGEAVRAYEAVYGRYMKHYEALERLIAEL